MDSDRLAHFIPDTPASHRPVTSSDFQRCVLAWRHALDDYASERIGFAELVDSCRRLAEASRRRRRSLRR